MNQFREGKMPWVAMMKFRATVGWVMLIGWFWPATEMAAGLSGAFGVWAVV